MNGIKEDPDVKMEPAYMDDEFFEDTGELTMPNSEVEKDVWLARIPAWLYEAVSNWDELAEGNDTDQIQIGEVVAFTTTSGIDKDKPMRIFLDERWRNKSKLPTAYQLDPAAVTSTQLGNTYVFTEKDLPGFKGATYGQWNRGMRPRPNAVQDPNARVERSRYRKAIPKQTALVGHATRQYTANPLDTKEFKEFSAQRIKQAIQGSHSATVITTARDVDPRNASVLDKKFSGFIRQINKPKSQLNKAARVSRSELIDMLHVCFDEFEYWPMKALKNRTHQPEQFLKETLGDIAQLVKSGPFASTWKRMDMFDRGRDTTTRKQEEAIVKDEDSDAEEMEDVV
ncbi:hypothetical protein ACN47E_003064 [Coniothyrium glycines]